jgi:hypothetical protein
MAQGPVVFDTFLLNRSVQKANIRPVYSASILIIICYRQKPIKVSHRTFILLNIWWLLANFAIS